jgi:hypothetical protein
MLKWILAAFVPGDPKPSVLYCPKPLFELINSIGILYVLRFTKFSVLSLEASSIRYNFEVRIITAHFSQWICAFSSSIFAFKTIFEIGVLFWVFITLSKFPNNRISDGGDVSNK